MGLFSKSQKQKETVERVKDNAREPLQINESKNVFLPIKTKEELEEEKWERRRWELTRNLVSQDRRSVVLGKLNMSDRAIARKARQLADATINELRKFNKNYNDEEQE